MKMYKPKFKLDSKENIIKPYWNYKGRLNNNVSNSGGIYNSCIFVGPKGGEIEVYRLRNGNVIAVIHSSRRFPMWFCIYMHENCYCGTQINGGTTYEWYGSVWRK